MITLRFFLSSIIVSSIICFSAFALNVDEPLQNQEQEARARALFYELRCVVCQGEAIADSPADVARDMRREVRRLIAAGKSDDKILTYFVTQYGEKVRMMPTFTPANYALWLLPLLALVLGAFLAWRRLFRATSL